jgi:signal peptidase I
MEPTLHQGQILFISRDITDLQINDIVVIKHNGETLIKRITGVEHDLYFWLNDPLEYLLNKNFLKPKILQHKLKMKFHSIPRDYYYVMGDNQTVSVDSKEIGLIPKSDIIGRL